MNEKYKWIIHDEYFDKVLEAIRAFLPEVIKTNKKGAYVLIHDLLDNILNGKTFVRSQRKYEDHFPCFPDMKKKTHLSDSENKEIIRVYFEFTVLMQVAEINEGTGFGELALLNNAPRSATISTVTDCIFAVLEK